MLQTYAFAYQRLMDFPHSKFDYETLTRINFFESNHKIINVKIHFNHQINLLVSLTILGGLSCFFLIKQIKLSIRGTEDINIGGTGLTNINFASIVTQVKFISMMKYFSTSLGQLVSTLDKVEKARVEKLTFQLLNQNICFSKLGEC